MIRLAYILTPITFGGAEKVSLHFLSKVDRSRFDIYPILLVRPWEEDSYFVQKLRDMGYAYESVPVAVTSKEGPLRVWRVFRKLFLTLKSGSFGLVHTQGYFADVCGLPAARFLNIPSLSTSHGYINIDKKLYFYNHLDSYVLRLCDRVITVSEEIKDELISRGVNQKRIQVIPNTVPLQQSPETFRTSRLEIRKRLNVSPDETVVGYIGRLSKEKGVAYLIAALAEIAGTGNNIKAILVGDGAERENLMEMVRSYGLQENIIFAGFQTDIEKWLPSFDIFVLPSLTEGTPMALLEAMAAGLPVIASAVGGVPRVVKNGVNGLLVSPGASDEIRQYIQSLIDNDDNRKRIGMAGANTIASEYNINSWCRTVEKCLTLTYEKAS